MTSQDPNAPEYSRDDDPSEFRQLWRRRRGEDQEIVALLRAIRSAGFDLSNPDDGDDERKLARIFVRARDRTERGERWIKRRASVVVWICTALGGAIVSQLGPELLKWSKEIFQLP